MRNFFGNDCSEIRSGPEAIYIRTAFGNSVAR
jgi:hypothetical protein